MMLEQHGECHDTGRSNQDEQVCACGNLDAAPSTDDHVIDSRDVIERIEALEGEKDALTATVTAAQEAVDTMEQKEDEQALLEWTEGDEGQELNALLALERDAEGYSSD